MQPYPKPQILELNNEDPRKCGEIHGEFFREHIKVIADYRIGLIRKDTEFKTESAVLDIASKHLPILKDFDESLYLELTGIAKGSNLNPEHIVALNHYTDLRDIKIKQKNPSHSDDQGCSMVYLPNKGKPILGQTWDISGYLLDYVIILKIHNSTTKSANDALVFSIPGCLGMTGMNSDHLGVCINNLNSTDGKVGIVWPALVRKMLKQKTASAAKEVVMNAPLGSGHHYSIADLKNFYGVETSGTKKKTTQSDENKVQYHTNHCLDSEMELTNLIKKTSSTKSRYDKLDNHFAKQPHPNNSEKLFELLGSVSMPPNEKDDSAVATCGALIMDLENKSALVCKGPPSSLFNNPPHRVSL